MDRSAAAVLATTLALMLALSGCTKESQSPEERFTAARDSFIDELGPDGAVKQLDGTMQASLEGMGDTEATIRVLFGANGVTKYIITVGGFFTMSLYCQESAGLQEFAGEVYESRGSPEMCDEATQPLPEDYEEEGEIVSLEEDGDTMTVVMRQTDDESGNEVLETWTLKDDKVRSVEVETEEGTFSFEATYGERRSLTTPEPTGRIPASIDYTTSFSDGIYRWEATEHEEEASLSDFRVDVEWEDENGTATTLASFDMAKTAQQSEGNFTFSLQDDGDGLLSTGDLFTIDNPDWQFESDYTVVVFDTWADLSIDENPMPLPAWLVVAALAGAVAMRRLG